MNAEKEYPREKTDSSSIGGSKAGIQRRVFFVPKPPALPDSHLEKDI